MKLGLIAGNGKFPFLVIEGAHRAGAQVAVAAIREETDPAIEQIADRPHGVGRGRGVGGWAGAWRRFDGHFVRRADVGETDRHDLGNIRGNRVWSTSDRSDPRRERHVLPGTGRLVGGEHHLKRAAVGKLLRALIRQFICHDENAAMNRLQRHIPSLFPPRISAFQSSSQT